VGFPQWRLCFLKPSGNPETSSPHPAKVIRIYPPHSIAKTAGAMADQPHGNSFAPPLTQRTALERIHAEIENAFPCPEGMSDENKTVRSSIIEQPVHAEALPSVLQNALSEVGIGAEAYTAVCTRIQNEIRGHAPGDVSCPVS
jgi:hypothetical protein